MKNSLLSTRDLSISDIEKILDRAYVFQSNSNYLSKLQEKYSQRFVANLFLEPSTRTRFSFEVAQKKLGLHVLNFQSDASSIQKGESLYDTLKTLESIGVETAVIRLKEEGLLAEVENQVGITLVNAGEGRLEHPTQALLDLYTIKKYHPSFHGLNVAIIGDIDHSRVARSNANLLSRLGANLIFSGPKHLMAQDLQGTYLPINEAIKEADVVMMLRIQFERMNQQSITSVEEYNREFGFTEERLKFLKSSAIILHPAPVNRGVEMDSSIVEHPQSKIFEQIQNGVFIRMAVIEKALGGEQEWASLFNREVSGIKISGL